MGLIIDNFAGGGGASTGIEAAIGRPVDVAINHWLQALEIHRLNHPASIHICEDVFKVKPATVTKGREVDLLWCSPDCTHFSRAKGGKPVSRKIRGLAWVALRWAKEAKPKIIILENVSEFTTWGPLMPDGRPDPKRRGLTFKRFVGNLRGQGYRVEWRELVAADYGAPTTRKRLFLVARCDGGPIHWPEPSHGKNGNHGHHGHHGREIIQEDLLEMGRMPWRAAAECIDWSIPCPSIFERKRPLAEKTLRRVAAGIRRYVIECGEPFIIPITHTGESDERVHGIREPMRTVTGAHRGELALVIPYIAGIGGRAGQSRPRAGDEPLGTITSKGDAALVAPVLVANTTANPPRGADEPLKTITTGGHHALVSAFLNKYRGESTGGDARDPMPTITGGQGSVRPAGAAHALGIITAHLLKLYGTSTGADLREPMPTITGMGQHVAEVRAFLVKYYGTNQHGQALTEPLHTITRKDRLGLVTVAGVDYQIMDIGLRMLTPRELARAQGFPEEYILPANKSLAVALIGNSVPPPVAEALVRANLPELCEARKEAA